ncbi:hypothetical protein F0L68_40415 [Solihabitans fulvus]|uniref:Uncharacterized protein n=1 Tax=Solihabitans fulvus TaxID=1892852 RepID=A0A5B2W7H3_9PSEU|nr:hypothetical protein [Solihabitans fulvus]KAA2247184.1 hypothetical protein F0L68_40415 [Solihabitans fulvus]
MSTNELSAALAQALRESDAERPVELSADVYGIRLTDADPDVYGIAAHQLFDDLVVQLANVDGGWISFGPVDEDGHLPAEFDARPHPSFVVACAWAVSMVQPFLLAYDERGGLLADLTGGLRPAPGHEAGERG